jgi:hypothetical protein
MSATQETVAEYAAKHGVTEAVVRDIAGLPAPVEVTVSAEQDKKNPGKVHFNVDGYDGPAVIDVGGSGFLEVEVKKGKFTHSFSTPGAKRVRLDLGGVIRWIDVEAGVNTDPGDDPEVEEVIPPGAPDFSQSLLGVDTNALEDVPQAPEEEPQAPAGGDGGAAEGDTAPSA